MIFQMFRSLELFMILPFTTKLLLNLKSDHPATSQLHAYHQSHTNVSAPVGATARLHCTMANVEQKGVNLILVFNP